MRIFSLSNCPLDEHTGSGYVALRYARVSANGGRLLREHRPHAGLRRVQDLRALLAACREGQRQNPFWLVGGADARA